MTSNSIKARGQVTLTKLYDGTKGQNGANGAPGAKGADGKTTYVHVAYSNSEDGITNFSVTDPIGRAYIGVLTDFVEKDSTNPSDYTWSLVKGEDGKGGEDGAPGKPGADGKTTYVHIAYANSSDGSRDFSTTENLNKLYIGVLTDEVKQDSTEYTKYTWSLFKGNDGKDGDTGIQGPKGADGRTPYVHFAYSNSADGNIDFSTTIYDNKKFIGTLTDYTVSDSTNPSEYTWSLIKGNDGKDGATGIQGPKGTDGRTPYVHFAYANSSDGGRDFSTTENSGKKYIGTLTDYEVPDSTDYTKYTWSRVKGDTGVGIANTVIEYQLTDTQDQPSDDSGWTTTIPNLGAGTYLWTRTTLMYTDGTKSKSYTISKQSDNTYTAVLTNDSITLPANSTGAVTDFSNSTGNFLVYDGTYQVDPNIVKVQLVQAVNVTVTIGGNSYTITAMDSSKSTGYFDLTYTYKGVALNKRVTVSKSRSGADGSTPIIVNLSANAQVFTFDSNNNANPRAQNILFKTTVSGTTSTPVYKAIPYDDSGKAGAEIVLSNSGTNGKLLQVSQIRDYASIVVTATIGSVSDSTTIVRVKDGSSISPIPDPSNTVSSNTPPSSPKDGDWWNDTSQTPNVLKYRYRDKWVQYELDGYYVKANSISGEAIITNTLEAQKVKYTNSNGSTTNLQTFDFNGMKTLLTDTNGNTYSNIESAVGSTKVVRKLGDSFNNLSVGGRNLLLGTEQFVGGWDRWQWANTWDADPYNGHKTVQTASEWSGPKYVINELFNRKVVEPNTDYTLSVKIKNTSSNHIDIYFWALAIGISNRHIIKLPPNSGWTTISTTFQFSDINPNIGNATMSFEPSSGIPSGQGAIIQTEMKFERGNLPTDWSPAPEDVDKQISKLQDATFWQPYSSLDFNDYTKQGSFFFNTVATKVNGPVSWNNSWIYLTVEQGTADNSRIKQTAWYDGVDGIKITYVRTLNSGTWSPWYANDNDSVTTISQTSDAIRANLGSPNLFPNSEFEKDYGYRYTNGNTSLSLGTKVSVGGRFNGRVYVTSTNKSWQGYWTRDIPVYGGQKYSMSVLVHYLNGGLSNGKASLDIWFVDKDWNRISQGDGGNNVRWTGQADSPYWVKLYAEGVTAPINAAYVQVSFLVNEAGSGQVATFTQPMLTATEKLQPYAVNNDITTQLELLKDNYTLGIDSNGNLISGITGNTKSVTIKGNAITLDGNTKVNGDFYSLGGNFTNINIANVSGYNPSLIKSNFDSAYGNVSITPTNITLQSRTGTTLMTELSIGNMGISIKMPGVPSFLDSTLINASGMSFQHNGGSYATVGVTDAGFTLEHNNLGGAPVAIRIGDGVHNDAADMAFAITSAQNSGASPQLIWAGYNVGKISTKFRTWDNPAGFILADNIKFSTWDNTASRVEIDDTINFYNYAPVQVYAQRFSDGTTRSLHLGGKETSFRSKWFGFLDGGDQAGFGTDNTGDVMFFMKGKVYSLYAMLDRLHMR